MEDTFQAFIYPLAALFHYKQRQYQLKEWPSRIPSHSCYCCHLQPFAEGFYLPQHKVFWKADLAFSAPVTLQEQAMKIMKTLYSTISSGHASNSFSLKDRFNRFVIYWLISETLTHLIGSKDFLKLQTSLISTGREHLTWQNLRIGIRTLLNWWRTPKRD